MQPIESRALLAALDAVTAMEANLTHQTLTKRTEGQNNRKPAQVQENA